MNLESVDGPSPATEMVCSQLRRAQLTFMSVRGVCCKHIAIKNPLQGFFSLSSALHSFDTVRLEQVKEQHRWLHFASVVNVTISVGPVVSLWQGSHAEQSVHVLQYIPKPTRSTRYSCTHAGIAIVGILPSSDTYIPTLSLFFCPAGFEETNNICVYRNELITELRCVVTR